MDASEYKHVVFGLIFLKYISDVFQAKYKELEAKKETEYTDPEDRDEYALAGMDNQLFVSKYQLELPKKEEMQRFLAQQLKEVGDGK